MVSGSMVSGWIVSHVGLQAREGLKMKPYNCLCGTCTTALLNKVRLEILTYHQLGCCIVDPVNSLRCKTCLRSTYDDLWTEVLS